MFFQVVVFVSHVVAVGGATGADDGRAVRGEDFPPQPRAI